MKTAIISITGEVCTLPYLSRNAKHCDMLCNVNGQSLKVHIRFPAEIDHENIAVGDMIAVIGCEMYKSIDITDSKFALNASPKEKFLHIPKGSVSKAAIASVSLIGDIDSKVITKDGNAEFAVHTETARGEANIHVIAEKIDENRFCLEKGDKVGLFGGVMDVIPTDKNSDFAVRVDASNVHLIPFYDGEQQADTL